MSGQNIFYSAALGVGEKAGGLVFKLVKWLVVFLVIATIYSGCQYRNQQVQIDRATEEEGAPVDWQARGEQVREYGQELGARAEEFFSGLTGKNGEPQVQRTPVSGAQDGVQDGAQGQTCASLEDCLIPGQGRLYLDFETAQLYASDLSNLPPDMLHYTEFVDGHANDKLAKQLRGAYMTLRHMQKHHECKAGQRLDFTNIAPGVQRVECVKVSFVPQAPADELTFTA